MHALRRMLLLGEQFSREKVRYSSVLQWKLNRIVRVQLKFKQPPVRISAASPAADALWEAWISTMKAHFRATCTIHAECLFSTRVVSQAWKCNKREMPSRILLYYFFSGSCRITCSVHFFSHNSQLPRKHKRYARSEVCQGFWEISYSS